MGKKLFWLAKTQNYTYIENDVTNEQRNRTAALPQLARGVLVSFCISKFCHYLPFRC